MRGYVCWLTPTPTTQKALREVLHSRNSSGHHSAQPSEQWVNPAVSGSAHHPVRTFIAHALKLQPIARRVRIVPTHREPPRRHCARTKSTGSIPRLGVAFRHDADGPGLWSVLDRAGRPLARLELSGDGVGTRSPKDIAAKFFILHCHHRRRLRNPAIPSRRSES